MEIFPRGHCNLDSHLLPSLAMDPITSRALSQRQVNHINNCVLEDYEAHRCFIGG
jgi:hypothetical protein